MDGPTVILGYSKIKSWQIHEYSIAQTEDSRTDDVEMVCGTASTLVTS